MNPRGDSTSRKSSSRMRGFTLIEMLVVLAIAGLLVALALPRLTGADEKAALRAAVDQLAAGLRLTRSFAMTHGRSESFVLDTASGAFRAGDGSAPAQIPRGVRAALVTVAQDRDGPHQGRIEFFADGSSTGGGITLAAANERSEVLVDWLTGRVSIQQVVHAAAR